MSDFPRWNHPLFTADTRKQAGWLDVDCIRCYEQHPDADGLNRPFIVCASCGNKRCPKATDHRLECTGSNEPGQKGSVYA
jgi:hypothetical protein